MDQETGRTAAVHLTHDGDYLGLLGPFGLTDPWWSSVGTLTERLSAEAGVPVVVVRLVGVTGGEGCSGGHTVYHAEALERPADRAPRPAGPEAEALLGPAERRAGWATPAGLRAALDWAERALTAVGRPVTGPVEQVRTWNLSGVFRLPTAAGPAWLKVINPAFNASEGEVIALFGAAAGPALVPTVLAADPAHGRVLLDDVPGEDCWGPSAEEVAQAVAGLVTAQVALAAEGRAGAAGLPDRTPGAVAAAVPGLLDRLAATAELTGEELDAARALAARLPELVGELAACGLPETVVHGDFHPGNWRSDGSGLVVIDFADTCFGHPVTDGLRPRGFVDGERWEQAAGEWARAWRERVPGCLPERALELAGPLVHFGYALRYQEFLDHIEDSERPYHEGDPAAEVRHAVAAAG
ncbi:Ser/Thr protein kinase RdoA involved in Cpx stress response, MazF antagonist [Streptomyces sp. TLI_053]|uniref:aminoglycoside phosphotransferase family protein n=1 Tax=Streptomyces sp. TLI_053 TaxID=1855352 RepID=UPI00087C9728|nr:aminoglycoside phosphotransferase family protein [Streptomyces sp. TLI_053]SDT05829.1 Ser/Thr protein kinase RdoA involved in Cpx stress response, MazF antagonist [Streptomyces sp. TLI_053]